MRLSKHTCDILLFNYSRSMTITVHLIPNLCLNQYTGKSLHYDQDYSVVCNIKWNAFIAVSYTHLDVYKRQSPYFHFLMEHGSKNYPFPLQLVPWLYGKEMCIRDRKSS